MVGCDGRFSASVMGGLMGGFLYVIRCGRVIVMVGSFQHQKNIGIKINKISHHCSFILFVLLYCALFYRSNPDCFETMDRLI